MKKKYILIICACILSTTTFSQLVTKGTESAANTANNKYGYAVGVLRFNNVGVHLGTAIEFGKANFFEIKDKFEYQKNAKAIDQGIDLINFMSTMGWELVQVILLPPNELYYFKKKM